MSPGARVALAAFLVAVAGPAGFFTYRFLAARHLIAPPGSRAGAEIAQPQSAAATAAGAQLSSTESTAASAAPREATPLELPDIRLPDTGGTPRKLSAWRGHPLIINFWATWCEPCRREIPLLESLRREAVSRAPGAVDRLEVIGIAVDDRDPVLKYIHQMGVDYPVLVGGEDAGMAAIHAFGMEAVLPFSVFADTRGRIVAVKVGELHPDDAQLILARLADEDAGRLPLQQARDQISAGLAALAAARARQAAPASAPSPATAPAST